MTKERVVNTIMILIFCLEILSGVGKSLEHDQYMVCYFRVCPFRVKGLSFAMTTLSVCICSANEKLLDFLFRLTIVSNVQ